MEESTPQPVMSAARRLELTIFMAGMSPREWERWMETGGWMPNMKDVVQCRLDAEAKRLDKIQRALKEAQRKRENENRKASRRRRKFKAASQPSPVWNALPRKRTA